MLDIKCETGKGGSGDHLWKAFFEKVGTTNRKSVPRFVSLLQFTDHWEMINSNWIKFYSTVSTPYLIISQSSLGQGSL